MHRYFSPMRAASGFTLLEILVTLVIVAAMAAMLVFSFQDSSQQKLRREASDFAVVLNAAADEAVMRGIEIGVVLDEEGYRFVVFDPETRRWQKPLINGLAEHEFPERYVIDLSLEGSEVDPQMIERIKLLAQRSDDERLRPSILVLSSGEVTPFKLTLSTDKNSEKSPAIISLHSDGLNPVVLDNDSTASMANAAKEQR
jgi:general secretion pathway protein H